MTLDPTAVHEAGHAVIAFVLGLVRGQTTIVPEDGESLVD